MNPCRQLDLDALIAAVRALEALAHERTVARLKQESDDIISPSHDGHSYTLPYDPASVFLLETMISISCQAPQHIEYLWFVTCSVQPTSKLTTPYHQAHRFRAPVGLAFVFDTV
jgi:hypothetical protein